MFSQGLGMRDGRRIRDAAAMLVGAEGNMDSRTVMEYLMSPVQRVAHEAGREMLIGKANYQ